MSEPCKTLCFTTFFNVFDRIASMTTGATHHRKSLLKKIKKRQLGVPFWTIWDQKTAPEGLMELNGTPLGSPRGPKGSPRRPKGTPRGPQGNPQGPPRNPQGSLWGPQGVPKGSPRGPKGSPRVPKGSPRGPQGVPRGSQRAPKADRATKESVE